jgi:hypothetical protein
MRDAIREELERNLLAAFAAAMPCLSVREIWAVAGTALRAAASGFRTGLRDAWEFERWALETDPDPE